MEQLPLLKKQDFVDRVQYIISLDERTRMYNCLNTDDYRLKRVLFYIMVWAQAIKEETNNQRYLDFYRVAEWVKLSYEDNQFNEQEASILKAHGLIPLLEFIWEIAQVARANQREVTDYLHQELVKEAL